MSTLHLNQSTAIALIIISGITAIILCLLVSWYFYERESIRTRADMINKTNYSPVKTTTIDAYNDDNDIDTGQETESTNSSISSRPIVPAILLSPSANNEHNKMQHMELPTLKTRHKGLSISSMLTDNSSFFDHMDSVRILAEVRYSISTRRRSSHASHLSLADKRSFIETELIETEKSYLNGLHVLMNEFIIPILSQKMIDIRYKDQITSNIPQIIQFHEEFLHKLLNKSVAKVFNEESKHFMIYTQYIADYDLMLDVYAQHRSNETLQTFLASKRRQKKPLTNYLVAPIQRIPRYILMLSDLKKHTKSSRNRDIDCALDKITKICNAINEKQREIENMSQCLKISQTLKNLDFDIIASERMYIDHFMFKRKTDDRNRQFFVFNDVVIIANEKWETKKVVKLENMEVKISNKENDEISIKIFDDEEKNENYKGAILYESVENNENVKSGIDAFCKVVNEHKNQLHEKNASDKFQERIGLKLIAYMSERGNVSKQTKEIRQIPKYNH